MAFRALDRAALVVRRDHTLGTIMERLAKANGTKLLVEEAGGTVSGMRGERMDLQGPYVLADNGRIHREIVDLFDSIFRGEYKYDMPPLPAPEWEMQRG